MDDQILEDTVKDSWNTAQTFALSGKDYLLYNVANKDDDRSDIVVTIGAFGFRLEFRNGEKQIQTIVLKDAYSIIEVNSKKQDIFPKNIKSNTVWSSQQPNIFDVELAYVCSEKNYIFSLHTKNIMEEVEKKKANSETDGDTSALIIWKEGPERISENARVRISRLINFLDTGYFLECHTADGDIVNYFCRTRIDSHNIPQSSYAKNITAEDFIEIKANIFVEHKIE